jgi:membrane protease YdiL (CAAX protease family)
MQPDAELSRRFFQMGCGVEIALGLLGGLALLPHPRPFAEWWRTDPHGLALGLAATLPPCLLFVQILQARRGPLLSIRKVLEDFARPLFTPWTTWQLAFISLLAGVGEELLFRGAIQGWAAQYLGPLPGWILASILFALAHCINRAYMGLTLILGLYLGGFCLAGTSLIPPMIVHALYDFFALIYLVRFHQPR